MDENLKKTEQNRENFEIELLFKDSDIEEIWNNPNPIFMIYDLLERNFRKKTGEIDFDSNLLMSLAEFHVNNLIFLKETFNFSVPIYCKLMNLLNILLNLRQDNLKNKSNTNVTKQTNLSTNKKDDEEKILIETDFSIICRNKLKDLKLGLLKLDLISQDKKKTGVVNNNSNQEPYHLKNTEVASILEYVNSFFFPYIKLYHHFVNFERKTEDKKINVIINKPLPVPPLCLAVKQIQDKIHSEEQELEDGKDANIKVLIIF